MIGNVQCVCKDRKGTMCLQKLYTYKVIVNSFIHFAEEAGAQDLAERNVRAVDAVFHCWRIQGQRKTTFSIFF